MIIQSAKFLISSPSVAKCPNSKVPEYAFIGRSNVGKSSLINCITGVKGLAMTSSKPGKTLLINYFNINDSWHLVDLPGYGFAMAGKKTRERLEEMIYGYVNHREQLTCLFVLIDCRHKAQKIDLEFINYLGENGIPFSLIFTKADKLSKSALKIQIENYKNTLLETWEELPPIFVTSSETGKGKEEILTYIEGINEQIQCQRKQ